MAEVREPWFLIRADANATIGIGHVMRCLALAEWAKDRGLTAVLCTKFPHSFLQQKLENLGGEYLLIPESDKPSSKAYAHSAWLKGNEFEDAEQTISAVKKLDLEPPLFIVLDHYALAAPWESILSNLTKNIVVIDDLSDRKHDCNIIVDQTFGKKQESYKDLVVDDCKRLIGEKFILLRKEFSSFATNRIKAKTPRLLIALGGSDPHNHSLTLAKWIRDSYLANRLRISILTTSINPNLHALNQYCDDSIELLIDVDHVASALETFDLCIGAAGSSSWERSALQLPTLTVVLASNQKDIASHLHKVGATINLGEFNALTPSTLTESILSVLDHPEKRDNLAERAQKVCDGLGCNRVLDEILNNVNLPQRVSIRPANTSDIDFVHKLQCYPETRRYARNPCIPSYAEHSKWMEKKLYDRNSTFDIIELWQDQPCGVVRLDPINEAKDTHEISIFIDPAYFGQGIAKRAIALVLKKNPKLSIIATVMPENTSSIKLFLSLGFSQTGQTTFLLNRNKINE